MVLKFTGLRKLVEALRYISLMVSLEVLPLTDAKKSRYRAKALLLSVSLTNSVHRHWAGISFEKPLTSESFKKSMYVSSLRY